MNNKYEPLTTHLASLSEGNWRPTFDDIELILGFELPSSARKFPAWWANQDRSSQAQSWLSAGWVTMDLDLQAEQVTFSRRGGVNPFSERSTRRISSRSHLAHGWDLSGEFRCELCLSWTHVGAVVLDSDSHLEFPVLPEHPGLYRMRIRRVDGAEARYVGETDNLRRRFGHYRHPGPTQQTNVRISQILTDALEQGAQVALSIATDQAWIIQNGTNQAADFSLKPVRRMFENFAQIVEGDVAVEDLNR